LGEHLLCKQGVVGSIPIASMVWRAWFAGHGLLGMVCWAWFGGAGCRHSDRLGFEPGACGSSPLGGVCVARGLLVFLGDCESGSGALLGAQDVSVGLGGAVCVRLGRVPGGP